MGDKIQAFDIFQIPLSSHYPLPLRRVTHCRTFLSSILTKHIVLAISQIGYVKYVYFRETVIFFYLTY